MENEYRLHRFEIAIYQLLWRGGVIFSIFCLISISTVKENTYSELGILDDGWSAVLDRKRDNSDLDWACFKVLCQTGWLQILFGHILVGKVAYHACPEKRLEVLMAYSISALLYLFPLKYFVGMFIILCLQYVISKTSTSSGTIWMFGLLTLYYSPTLVNITIPSIRGTTMFAIRRHAHLMFTWGIVRGISFSCENLWHKMDSAMVKTGEPDDNDTQAKSTEIHQEYAYEFFDYLQYMLYCPVLFGPLLCYNDFMRERDSKPPLWNTRTILNFIFSLCRVACWALGLETATHYVYASVIRYDISVARNLSTFESFGVFMANFGVHFAKYTIIFGLPASVCALDGFTDVPGGPKSIPVKNLSYFWKNHDRGLYKWLMRYIYIPCGGSRRGGVAAAFNMALVFGFIVVFWQRVTASTCVWGFVNWFGAVIEPLGLRIFSGLPTITAFANRLSASMKRRALALWFSVTLSSWVISNIYFFTNIEIGSFLITCLYAQDLLSVLFVHVCLYSGIQLALELNHKEI